MTLITKLFLGAGGAASLAAGGYGVYELVRPKTVGQQLIWEGKTLGDVNGSKDDAETSGLWAKLYAKYISETDNKFKDPSPAINSRETLKAHCKKVFDSKISESKPDDLEKAKFWCIVESEKLGSS